MNKVIYLVQGEVSNIVTFSDLQSDSSDLLTLTYDHDLEKGSISWKGNIFFPKSTWAEGRNKLLEVAQSLGIYDYYIFIDDDARIVKGNFTNFNSLLFEYKPDIGLPLCNQIKESYRFSPNLSVQRPIALDQLVQAYSFKAVSEKIVLPFVTEYDNKGWWISCEINQYLILSQYPQSTLQFNEIEFENTQHMLETNQANSMSIYLGGERKEIEHLSRKYIVENFENIPNISNSLFHNPLVPKLIYGPSLKDTLPIIYENISRMEFRQGFTVTFRLVQRVINNVICQILNNKNIIDQSDI